MKEINYVIWQEDKYYLARCLNVEVSSFGESIEEAIKNLKEAVELYFEGEEVDYSQINPIILGRDVIDA